MDFGTPCGRFHSSIAFADVTKADVFSYGDIEQETLLGYETEQRAERREFKRGRFRSWAENSVTASPSSFLIRLF
jgi:hypothetical protein